MDLKNLRENNNTNRLYRKEKCIKLNFLAMTTIPLLPILHLRLLPIHLPQIPSRSPPLLAGCSVA
jgi:hypothetical protein